MGHRSNIGREGADHSHCLNVLAVQAGVISGPKKDSFSL